MMAFEGFASAEDRLLCWARLRISEATGQHEDEQRESDTDTIRQRQTHDGIRIKRWVWRVLSHFRGLNQEIWTKAAEEHASAAVCADLHKELAAHLDGLELKARQVTAVVTKESNLDTAAQRRVAEMLNEARVQLNSRFALCSPVVIPAADPAAAKSPKPRFRKETPKHAGFRDFYRFWQSNELLRSLSGDTLFSEYERWCLKNRCPAYGRSQFFEELRKVRFKSDA